MRLRKRDWLGAGIVAALSVFIDVTVWTVSWPFGLLLGALLLSVGVGFVRVELPERRQKEVKQHHARVAELEEWHRQFDLHYEFLEENYPEAVAYADAHTGRAHRAGRHRAGRASRPGRPIEAPLARNHSPVLELHHLRRGIASAVNDPYLRWMSSLIAPEPLTDAEFREAQKALEAAIIDGFATPPLVLGKGATVEFIEPRGVVKASYLDDGFPPVPKLPEPTLLPEWLA